MENTGFSVKTEVFEGPLDLLLDLVSKRKLFVSDVSLAKVTDDFISYIESTERSGESISISESAEFIVVASTLMLIKSRSLLPSLPLTDEEEESIQDLEARLVVYARTKELAKEIQKIFGVSIIFEKTASKEELIVFSPDSKTNTNDLLEAVKNVLEALPKKEVIPKAIVRKLVSLEETIEKLAERITKNMKMSFNEFTGTHLRTTNELTHENKVTIIVGFLAMLELVKRGALKVTQDSKGEIEMETESVALPNYI